MGNVVLHHLPRTQDPGEVEAWHESVEDSLDLILRERVVTRDATPTILLTVKLDVQTNYLFEFFITARRTGGSAGTANDGAAWRGWVVYKMVVATATKVGSETIALQGADNGGLTIGLSQSDDNVQWQVTGVANQDYAWSIELRTFTISL